jgi:hypothetical protein
MVAFRKLVLNLPLTLSLVQVKDLFAFSIILLQGSKPHAYLPSTTAHARGGYEPERLENIQEEALNLGYWDNWVLTNLEASDMIGT